MKKSKIYFVIFLATVSLFCVTGCKKKKELSEEDILIGYLNDMAKDFWETVHYPRLGGSEEEKLNFLERYSTVGVSMDLENLGRYENDRNKDLVAKFYNSKTNELCDLHETKVIIYPKKPYGLTDYDVTTILECGFDEIEEE